MDKEKNVFDFIGSVFMTYGITILLLIFIISILNENQLEGSNMFTLGKAGLPITFLLQFLIISIINTGLQYIFCTDKFIKDISMNYRLIWMFASMLIIMSLLIMYFNWFSKGGLMPWLMFVLMFVFSSVVSIMVTNYREKYENRKMEEGLNRLKRKIKEGHTNV